jgi:hypothetical protein
MFFQTELSILKGGTMKLSQVLAAGIVSCSLVFAQEAVKAAPPAAAEQPAAEKAAAKKAPVKKTAVKRVTGTVVSVDAAANTVIIKGRKGEDTLQVGEKTLIMAVVTLPEMKAGSKVKVKYTTVKGVKTAAAITEVPAAPAVSKEKKGKKKKAAPVSPEAKKTDTAAEKSKDKTKKAAVPAVPAVPSSEKK